MLAPARVAVGRGRSTVGINRRKRMPDGKIHMAPNSEGPTDPEVMALAILRQNGDAMASLFDYACHSRSLGPPNRLISGDVLGIAEQFVEETMGGKYVGAAFAGASGDIDPASVVAGFGETAGENQEPVRLGRLLGEEVVRVLRSGQQATTGDAIRSAGARILLPAKNADTTKPIDLIAARIGDIAFLGLDCEALVEIGLAIKAASPFEHTFIITNCNGWTGYLPPGHRYQEGGYEVERSGFGATAAKQLIEGSVKLLESLR
jgi:hypothetical protein